MEVIPEHHFTVSGHASFSKKFDHYGIVKMSLYTPVYFAAPVFLNPVQFSCPAKMPRPNKM
jgi:hypothetical protein